MKYPLELIPLALELLAEIKDQREQQILSQRTDKLKSVPEKQGKPLLGKFKGYRSVAAVGQRYRIIYRVERDRVVVLGVGVGLRREGDRQDIYAIVGKFLEE